MRVGRAGWICLVLLVACTRVGYRRRRGQEDSGLDASPVTDLATATDNAGHDSATPDVTVDWRAPDSSVPDAVESGIDGFVCPTACSGGCVGGICLVAGSSKQITCPKGLPCHVICAGLADCPNAINCDQAASCTIECLGDNSCGSKITCGTGPCTVVCGAAGTQGQCSAVIDCAQSCACEVSCDGFSSCGAAVICPAGCDPTSGKGCTTALPGCQSCP